MRPTKKDKKKCKIKSKTILRNDEKINQNLNSLEPINKKSNSKRSSWWLERIN